MNLVETEAKPTYSRTVKLYIDADSMIYRACHAGEREHKEAEIPKSHPLFEEMPISTMQEMQISIFHSMIEGKIWSMREHLNSQGIDIEEYYLVFTPKGKQCEALGYKINFRYELIDAYNKAHPEAEHPQYKASRKGMPLPEGIPEMLDYVATLDNVIFSNHCEADDVVYREKVKDIDGVLIACLDKDIYSGTPSGDLGHYNYNKDEWIYTTEEEAHLFYYRQCLTGDSSDGIKGIHRYGPKTAEKDLPEFTDHEDMWYRVLDIFEDKGYSEEYALLMMRLVNLSQLGENGEIVLWEPIHERD